MYTHPSTSGKVLHTFNNFLFLPPFKPKYKSIQIDTNLPRCARKIYNSPIFLVRWDLLEPNQPLST